MPRSLLRSTSRSRSTRSAWMPESLRDAMLRSLQMAGGGAIILVALIFALSLLSYDTQDISWNTASSVPSETTHNWIGSFGSYSADIIWQFFGFGGLLICVVLGAWGWRVAADRGLDLLPWRILSALVALLAFAVAFASFNFQFSPDTPAAGGALGKVLSIGLISLLPAVWGQYLVIITMLVIAFSTLYMACALTLDEWHVVAKALHQAVMWAGNKVYRFGLTVWHILRHEHTGIVEDDKEEKVIEELPPDDFEEEEDIPAPAAAAKRTRVKAPIIKRPAASARQARLALRPESDMALPPLELLQWPESARQPRNDISEEALEKNAKLLESVLADFGVNGSITKVSPGPVVTLYELEPSPGTRAARVISLADDIARNMSAASVRVAVVPGRNVIGIELPNARRETVYLRELLSSDAYNDVKANLPLVLGKDIAGMPIIADMARMPHLLIAGTTGSGKSVAINTMILSLLYRLPPQKCRFIMIDPKMLELSVYEGIPHLLAPVVTEPKKAIMALRWTVREMEERYRAMSKLGVRNIEGYNMRLREASKNGENLTRTVQTGFDKETGKPIYEEQPLDLTELPFIVVIVDEMADLMIVAGKEIEGAIQRLAQMARAAGIHILMATQRPSVDVITGTIKANFPTRISFQVTSKIDSRTILGEQGAEQLLGQGDMLYMAGGGRITRVHGPFVRDDEVEAIVKFLKKQGEPEYLDEVTKDDGQGDFGGGAGGGLSGNMSSGDDLYDKAVDVVLRERKASTSFIQRHLQIGYNRAATLIERMEREGLISSANAVGKREVFGRNPNED
ncbi:MAG: DNA translocase FtsK 4TM domain-containing protein [Alphaproteobacteria bacterium]